MANSDNARILLVDDTEANRYTTARVLRQAGYEITEAASGQDALAAVRQGVDLLILDVKLPDMSGLEISRLLRLDPVTRSLPILQLSATYTERGDKVKGLDAGADTYLVSPVAPEELLAHVRTLLRLKRTQDELRQRVRDLETTQEQLAQARDALARQNELLEARVQERTAQLQETIQDLETFSYSITHDMRAPLRAMQGFSNLLLEAYAQKLDAQGRDYLDRIAGSAERLDLLIRDVLAYSQVTRGPLKLVPVDLAHLLHTILRDYPGFQPPASEIQVAGSLPQVLGHPAFLTQCLTNLVGNAVKFVAPGTCPRIHISAATRDGKVLVYIKDNGIGIPPEHQSKLFKLFHRAQHSYPGTGVGLAIVRKAVERMGGKVGFESQPGHGSTFWLELQAADAERET